MKLPSNLKTSNNFCSPGLPKANQYPNMTANIQIANTSVKVPVLGWEAEV